MHTNKCKAALFLLKDIQTPPPFFGGCFHPPKPSNGSEPLDPHAFRLRNLASRHFRLTSELGSTKSLPDFVPQFTVEYKIDHISKTKNRTKKFIHRKNERQVNSNFPCKFGQTRYDVIWNFTPIIIFSTSRSFMSRWPLLREKGRGGLHIRAERIKLFFEK